MATNTIPKWVKIPLSAIIMVSLAPFYMAYRTAKLICRIGGWPLPELSLWGGKTKTYTGMSVRKRVEDGFITDFELVGMKEAS